MAFRPLTVKKQSQGFGFKIVKILIAIVAVTACAVIAAILYFNGQNIKAPLIKFLSDRTSFTINCQQIEFSALYPNVLKLQGVSIDKTHIDEIYVEYDLQSIIKSDTLKLKYFYAKGVTASDENINSFRSEKFGFNDILIEKLDLVDCPVSLQGITSSKAALSLSQAYIGTDGLLSFDAATLNFEEGHLDNTEIKKFSGKLSNSSDEISADDLSFQIFGGTVSGSLSINKTNREIVSRNLSIRNLIFKEDNALSDKYTIRADTVSVNNCLLALPAQDLMLGDVTGKLDGLKIGDGKISYNFTGRVGEISKPSLQLTADESRIKAEKTEDELLIRLKGNLFNTTYKVDASFRKDDGLNKLTIHSLNLKGGKIEATDDLINYLKQSVFDNSLTLESLNIENTEVVSFIDKYPFSVQSVNLNLENLYFDRHSKVMSADDGKIDFSFDNGYYSDLFISHFSSRSTIDEEKLITFVPEIRFNKSSASLTAQFDHDFELEKLTVTADDFELSELNSNLINHLLNGKVKLECSLNREAIPSDNPSLPRHISVLTNPDDSSKMSSEGDSSDTKQFTGKAVLTGKSLLISELGLDLVNGGPKKSYSLTKEQFLESIRDADAGLYDLNLKLSLEDNTVAVRGSSDLISSHATLNGKIDLKTNEMCLKTTFVSLNKDCITSLVIKGDIDNPGVFITPVSRGNIRPGINDEILDGRSEEKSAEVKNNGEPAEEAPVSVTVSEIP
ncbi:MAG: hypothetical protein ACI4UM_04490 [Succinivibrio sp.]